jgi:outer membrane lipoprotein-sorting protein
MAAKDGLMNKSTDRIEERLGLLGQRLAGQPSVVDRVMDEVDRAEPVRIPKFNQWRILTIMFKPRNLVVTAAVLAVVVFGVRPWDTNRENGPGEWWLTPPSAWASELQAAIEEAGQQGFSCQEHFVSVTSDGSRATSSSTSTFFFAGNRYRRDNYEQGRLRESQWYVQEADGLTMTSVRYNDKTYTITHDPKARQEDVDSMRQIEALAQLLDKSGRRLGTARVEGQDAVEFEIAAKKIDAQADEATMHIWLGQATKMPLKITYEFADRGCQLFLVARILVQDHFDWNPTLPADTFEPEIPAGFTKVESK